MNLLSIVTVVSIGERKVGDGCPCLISLEPGATYTNIDEAKFLTKATADAGAEAIKFQTFVTNDCDRMMGIKDLTVDFTTTTGKKQELYYDAIKRRELSNQEWIELSNYEKN